MNETSVPLHKTFKEQLRPTPAQQAALEGVLWRCRTLYNTALEQRISLYRQRGVSISRYTQEAELKELRATYPEYAALHSHVLQDVLARLDKTYQAFFRRVHNGQTPGFPRFHGKERYHSFTYKEYGNGARLDNGYLVLSTIGRIAVHWSRPLAGIPKTVTVSHEADGWYMAISCADVPVQPLPETGRETGIDVGLKVFLITADGEPVETRRDPPALPPCRAVSGEVPAAGLQAQEGQPSAPQGGVRAGKGTSARAPPTHRLPPQDSAQARAPV